MFLTGEGALLGAALAALVCGGVAAGALLRLAVRKPKAAVAVGRPTSVAGLRRVSMPAGGPHRV